MRKQIIKPENWFWCDLCRCVSYNYECECHATSCNAAGCDKCAPTQKIVDMLRKLNLKPTEAFAKANNLKKWGSVKTPETKLMEEIFGS